MIHDTEFQNTEFGFWILIYSRVSLKLAKNVIVLFLWKESIFWEISVERNTTCSYSFNANRIVIGQSL